jgi:hypothetical protein
LDGFEEWQLDDGTEVKSVVDVFLDEVFRIVEPDDTANEEKALWDDCEAEQEDMPKPDDREKDVFEIEQDEIEASIDLYGETDGSDDDVPWYDSLKQHPIYQELLQENKDALRKRLVRELKEEALERIEFAARSVHDYKQVVLFWDKKDASAARARRNHEELRGDTPMEWNSHLNETSGIAPIYPAWMNNPTYAQLRRGSFLDCLFDCPYEMHNLTSREYLRRPVMELKEEHKELLYFLYLRLYDPQCLAILRGQTDRNIRKVRDVLLRKVRRKVYASLQQRIASGCSLTLYERTFLTEYNSDGTKLLTNTEKDGDDHA